MCCHPAESSCESQAVKLLYLIRQGAKTTREANEKVWDPAINKQHFYPTCPVSSKLHVTSKSPQKSTRPILQTQNHANLPWCQQLLTKNILLGNLGDLGFQISNMFSGGNLKSCLQWHPWHRDVARSIAPRCVAGNPLKRAGNPIQFGSPSAHIDLRSHRLWLVQSLVGHGERKPSVSQKRK